MNYYRICKSLADKGELVPEGFNITKFIEDNKGTDLYISLYKYNERHKKRFDEKGTISGITDTVSSHLIWDLDSKDFEQVRKDAITILDRIEEVGLDKSKAIVSFSGNKGLHIEMELDKDLTVEEYKHVTKSIAKDLQTFDPKINNPSRLIRLPFTKHQDSGLYKTPLEYDELKSMSVDDIRSLAKEGFDGEIVFDKASIPGDLLAITKEDVSNSSKNSSGKLSSTDADLDYSKRPKWLSPRKYALLNGYFPQGTRSYALMILASTYRSQGMPKEVTYHALKGAAELQADRFDTDKFPKSEIWDNIINVVYSETWNGGTYSEDSFPDDLVQYLDDLNVPSKVESEKEDAGFKSSGEVFSSFKNFAENIDKNTIKTGIGPLDDIKDFRITTSMLVGLLGAPSSGKTQTALKIMKHSSMHNQQVAFFSMDMGAPLVFQRLAQNESGYHQEKLFEIFKNNDMEEINKIRSKINDKYGNVHFSFKTAMTTAGIRQGIMDLEKKHGKIRIAVVDYLECISASISDPTAKVSMISQELKDIATDLDVCVLLLLQPPKRVGDPSKPILSYTDIKGAATVAQACSIVLSLWREGFNPKTTDLDNYISFAAIKNRMGKLCQIDCTWDGLTGKIGYMEDIQRQDLEDLRKMNEMKGAINDDF